MARLINGMKMIGDKWHYFLNGKEVTEKAFRKVFPEVRDDGIPGASADWGKAIISDALAVHPKKRQEAIEDAAKRGVPTEFTEQGQPIFRSRQQRTAYMKAYGYYDRDAGYGDPQYTGSIPFTEPEIIDL